MSDTPKKNLSRTFAKSAIQDALDKKLIDALCETHLCYERRRWAEEYLKDLAACKNDNGSDWLNKWNGTSRNWEHKFVSDDRAAEQEREWKATVSDFDTVLAEKLGIIKGLVLAGADPNAHKGGPLSVAAGDGHVLVIKILFEAGASLERRDGYPYTAYGHDPLEATWSQRGNKVDAAKYLLELGCKLEARDIYWASQEGSEGIVKLFEERGMRYCVPPLKDMSSGYYY